MAHADGATQTTTALALSWSPYKSPLHARTVKRHNAAVDSPCSGSSACLPLWKVWSKFRVSPWVRKSCLLTGVHLCCTGCCCVRAAAATALLHCNTHQGLHLQLLGLLGVFYLRESTGEYREQEQENGRLHCELLGQRCHPATSVFYTRQQSERETE